MAIDFKKALQESILKRYTQLDKQGVHGFDGLTRNKAYTFSDFLELHNHFKLNIEYQKGNKKYIVAPQSNGAPDWALYCVTVSVSSEDAQGATIQSTLFQSSKLFEVIDELLKIIE